MYSTLRLANRFRPRFTKIIERLNQFLAALMLMIIIGTTVLFLPITYLGYDSTFGTQEIFHVEPGSPADQAGLRIGDRILTLYNRPIEEVEKRLDVIKLIGAPNHPIPITVERGGETVATTIEQEPPPLSFQAVKLAMGGLALICWTTGYLLGVVRRHEVPGSPLVATYWLLMGGLIGSLVFAMHAAFPIFLAQLWLIITFLAPLAVYIHLWFPTRQLSEHVNSTRAGLYLLGVSLVLNGVLVTLTALQHKRMSVVDILFLITPWAIIGSLAVTAVLLIRGYYRTMNQHIRRQVRLIASACISVMLLWILSLGLPDLVLVRPSVLTLALGAVPISYLAGIRSANLYRLDRVARRFVLHMLTITVLGVAVASATHLVGYTGARAVLWMAVAFVALYRFVQHNWIRLLPGVFREENQQALEQAIHRLTTTLVRTSLVEIVIEGVRAQFGQPALAFFLADIRGKSTLTLYHAERMESLPAEILAGALTSHLAESAPTIQSKDIREQVTSAELRMDEQELLGHPAIVLWCPVRHTHGHLLGLLVLGMQADVDPYSKHDEQGLHHLIAATSLALANSVAYERQVEDQEEIRDLYQALQGAQDTAAEALARELHDQIINVHVRLNIVALKKIVPRLQEGDLRSSLEPVLRREKELIYALRRISEELHPMGIDDPVGLPMVLSMEVERQNRTWEGKCRFAQIGTAISLTPRVQHEAFRIAREAINNAIKHANAMIIEVSLEYPTEQGRPVQLTVKDDGRNAQSVPVLNGHRGVRYMQESARIAGGKLSIEVESGQSTTVRFMFPVEATPAD